MASRLRNAVNFLLLFYIIGITRIKCNILSAALGLLPDEENPIFLFSQTHKDLLVDIINRKIDAVELARIQLRNRGMNGEGRFVGWKNDTPAYH